MRYACKIVTCCLFAAAVILPLGCEEEPEIRTYSEPKGQAYRPVAQMPPGHPDLAADGGPSGGMMSNPFAGIEGPVRMITAIVPHEEMHWFFKVAGPKDVVDANADKFRALVQSVKFVHEGDRHVTWKTPEGWQELPASGMRAATFLIDAQPGPVEVTVIPLPPSDLLDNVNRWRGQMNLPRITATELAQDVEQVQVGGEQAWIVDLTGQGTAPGSGQPATAPNGATATTPVLKPPAPVSESPAAPALLARPGGDAPPAAAPQQATTAGGITYTKPEGWTEKPNTSAMRVASFNAGEGNQAADVSVIPLGGAAGSPLDNVNRWRGQVGLPPIDQQQFDKDVVRVEIGGTQGYYVHLVAPEATGDARQAILAAFTSHDGRTWFFKMQGPAKTVADQKPAFETFIRSIRFGGES